MNAKTFNQNPPCAVKTDIHRHSENGDGSVQWSLLTDYTLDQVKVPGFFRLVGKHGLKKHDTVHVVCQQYESKVTHADFAVKGTHPTIGIELQQLGQANEVQMGAMTPFERLGAKPTANRQDIDIAYRQRAKRLHPDKGGDTEAMQELNKARDECLLFIAMKEQAA